MEDVGKNDLIIPSQFNEALVYIDAVKKKMKRAGVDETTINEYFKIRGRENPYEEKVPIKFFTFRPKAPLGGGPGGLTFEPTEMKKMIATGKQLANEVIALIPQGDITWA